MKAKARFILSGVVGLVSNTSLLIAATQTELFDPANDFAGAVANGWSGNDNGFPHNYGFSNTDNTGGHPSGAGEAGGQTVRIAVNRSHFADTTLGGTLTLNNPLSWKGEVIISSLTSFDHTIGVGFFNTTRGLADQNLEILGFLFADSSATDVRMFSSLRTASVAQLGSGNIVRPDVGVQYTFEAVYDPGDAPGEFGSLQTTFTSASETLVSTFNLTEAQRLAGANFDAFGWFTTAESVGNPAQTMTSFIDTLEYTVVDVVAPSSRWKVDSDGNWSNPDNWEGPAGNPVPNAIDAIANFTDAISDARTVTVDAPQTVGTINFNNEFDYEIAGTSTLTLDVSSGQAAINVTGGHVISAPVVLNDDTTVSVPSGGDSLAIITDVTATGRTLTKTGDGGLQLNHLRGTALNIIGGVVRISEKMAPNDPSGTSVVQSLSLFGVPGPSSNARLDLNNNSLIVDYSGASPLSTMAAQIQFAYKNEFTMNFWEGTGITSSTAAAVALDGGNIHKTGLGYAEASAIGLGTGSIFAGQMLTDDSAVLVRYTLNGDANIDGTVNGLDFNAVATNFGLSDKEWFHGDFNYDGIVNTLDFDQLAINFNLSLLAAPALGAAVPEPGGVGIAACAAGLLMRRRRLLCFREGRFN